jgi:hypothetical protein
LRALLNAVVPPAISRMPSAMVFVAAKVLSPVHAQPFGAREVKLPVPVMSPPKVPEPRRVPPESVHVPVPTG